MKRKPFSNELFQQQLTIGHKWTTLVAERLNNCGIEAEVTAMDYVDEEAEMGDYADEQDVTLITGHCVEVKSRNLEFGADPKSFPYTTAFVDTVGGWAKKINTPIAVVFASQITGEMLVVMTDTFDQWGSVKKFDRVRGYSDNFHTVQRRLLLPFDEGVKQIEGIMYG